MGYNLYITRRKSWSETGRDIPANEWLACIARDPELRLSPDQGPHFARWDGPSQYPDAWFDWDNGNVFTKNPDEALITKALAIARQLDAQVQGDDGEIYRTARESYFPQPSLMQRLGRCLSVLIPARPLREIHPPFQVGDRVLDAFQREATVLEIDTQSNHRLGRVKVHYDDGRELDLMLAACGLHRIGQEDPAKKPT